MNKVILLPHTFFAATLVLLLSVQPARSQAGHKPIVPLEPAELLKSLPATPAGWQLRKSNAKAFFVEWLCSQATREFERIPPSLGGTPGPPQVTIVKLVDTGYFPAFNGLFENFRVGRYGAFESLMIRGMRARRSKIADRETLQVSVRGRFIVSVEVKNQPQASEQPWLNTFDFARLNAIPDSGSAQLPKPIRVKTVDELMPARNSTSTIYWGGPATATEREATNQ